MVLDSPSQGAAGEPTVSATTTTVSTKEEHMNAGSHSKSAAGGRTPSGKTDTGTDPVERNAYDTTYTVKRADTRRSGAKGIIDTKVQADVKSLDVAVEAFKASGGVITQACTRVKEAEKAVDPMDEAVRLALYPVVAFLQGVTVGGREFCRRNKSEDAFVRATLILDNLPEDDMGVPSQLMDKLRTAHAAATMAHDEVTAAKTDKATASKAFRKAKRAVNDAIVTLGTSLARYRVEQRQAIAAAVEAAIQANPPAPVHTPVPPPANPAPSASPAPSNGTQVNGVAH